METAKTADYALSTLLELEHKSGQTISQLAAALGLSRSVAQRIVVTLHNRAFVVRAHDGRYSLGPALITLVQELPHQLATAARPFVRELAVSSRETVVVAVAEAGEAVVIARRSGSTGPVRVEYEVGFRHPLTRGASGLSILAHLPATRRKKLDPVDAEVDLDAIARLGYARTSSQLREHMEGLAAPVLSEIDGVIGSIAIIAPSGRADTLDDNIDSLRHTAREAGRAYDRERSFTPAADRGE